MGALDLPGLIQGEATSGLAWRHWLAGLRCHELSVPDWLPAHARLVIVAPHPDDEILASGGLIATHVAQGGRVLIVAVIVELNSCPVMSVAAYLTAVAAPLKLSSGTNVTLPVEVLSVQVP